MKFISLLVVGVSCQASLFDEINRERVERGQSPVVKMSVLSALLRDMIRGPGEYSHKRPTDSFSYFYSPDVCDAFRNAEDCFRMPAPEFVKRFIMVVKARPASDNTTVKTDRIGNIHGRFDISGRGTYNDPAYKFGGEATEGGYLYAILADPFV
ncbi:hypothetical protein DSO57_1005286 [Entomophthora muscae]|uniref:Uncharacterized protein n=1 Tax=Entomophthora muscae TaxID=34485 RepID=A0ACC2TII8_9FUNG|nr:hypothetical protein DSO57_1005286 [Entomophthora muscae]